MPIRFGDHSADQGVSIDAGMYDASIKSMAIVMDGDKPKVNDSGKTLCDIFFKIDEDNALRRRYPIAFGQNTANKQWAAFAKVVEAATGLKCGDPKQRDVTDTDMVGRAVRIVVESNDRGYSDVINVLPAPKNGTTSATKPKPQPVAAQPEEADQLEEIPF